VAADHEPISKAMADPLRFRRLGGA